MTRRLETESSVKLGFTGVGKRGTHLLEQCLTMDDVSVVALCDRNAQNLEDAVSAVTDAVGSSPEQYEDHRTMVAQADIDGVVIGTSWRGHIPLAIDALATDVYPAIEVGPASTVEECWDLVKAEQASTVSCMMLENDCYKRDMMTALRMVRSDLFGELIHARGGYLHDLRELINSSHDIGRRTDGLWYRTLHNLKRNGDIYPTHGMGPLAMYLNINRGNRFVSLKSTASKSRGLETWAAENLPDDHPAQEYDWAMGDIVTTTLKCANGETVTITHDVALPRPKETQTLVQGTKGLWRNTDDSVYVEGRSPDHEWESFESYRDEFEHPLWTRYRDAGVKKSGHGGIDFLALRDFVTAVKHGARTPIDAYDTATWRAISPLSEQSIELGGEPVSFPDFTNGKWMSRTPAFGLEEPVDGRPPTSEILETN